MKEQLRFVQILRGFAAICVLLFNLNGFTLTYFKQALFSWGNSNFGIDLFFVITGFIITYVHFKETQHHSSVRKFLMKRFVRVYPFYWLVLMITIGLESPDFADKPTLVSAINPTTIDGLVNILKNILLYPMPDANMPVGIAWGLSHAIIFYLLFAVSIRLGWTATKIIFGLWLATIILYSFYTFSQSSLIDAVAASVNIEMLAGCVAGYLFIKNKMRVKTALLSLIASAIITVMFFVWSGINNAGLAGSMLTGLVFSLLIYCAASIDRRKLSMRPFKKYAPPILVLTGDAAYSIFLTHLIFIPYLCIAFNKVLNVAVVPDFLKNFIIILVFFLSIIAGIVTFIFIERPLLNFLRKQLRLRRQKKNWI